VVTLAASTLPLVAFDAGRAAPAAAIGSVTTAALAIALSALALSASIAVALPLGFVEYALHPLRLFVLGGAGLAALSMLARIGFLRAGICIGALLLAATALEAPAFAVLWPRRVSRPRRWTEIAAAATFSVAAVVARRWVPLDELARHPDEVVFVSDCGPHRYAVTAAPGGYELFADGQLVIASLDAHRRAAALAEPIVRLAGAGKHVLLLHGGTGVIEGALLERDRAGSVTIVGDAELFRLAKRLRWLSTLGGGALESPHARPLAEEPSTWLSRTSSTFDVVIDDLPAPTGYGIGKYYTRHYFELLAAHTRDHGVWVVPATSAAATPRAFAGVVATARAVAPFTLAYHVAIPTLGVASYVVGSNSALPHDDLEALSDAPLDHGKDLGPASGALPSTLSDQRTVVAFQEERDLRTPR
jgi:spermidine synthase